MMGSMKCSSLQCEPAHVQAQDKTGTAGQKPISETFFLGELNCFLGSGFSGQILS